MRVTPDPNLDLLIAHDAWVRRLAQRMSRDAHLAEDLAQDTWLAALRSKWQQQGSARSFLAGVLRKRALHAQRSRARQDEHESRVEPPGAAATPEERLERAELGRELSRLLVQLEEPFRRVVLLKVQGNLPNSAIANQLGVPLKTVESRLARGLARLRESWRRRHPEHGQAWIAWLAGLGPPKSLLPHSMVSASAASKVSLGIIMIKTKVILFSMLLAGAGGLAYLALLLAAQDERAQESTQPARMLVDDDLGPTADDTPLSKARSSRSGISPDHAPPRRAVAAQSEVLPSVEPESAGLLRGRVVDPEGYALPALGVVFEGAGKNPVEAFSDGTGRFEFPNQGVAGRLGLSESNYEALFELSVPIGGVEGELLLVAARHRSLAGVVRDAWGVAMRDIPVGLELPPGFSARFDAVFDHADQHMPEQRTDEEGRFELERVPVVSGALLVARLDGYEPASLDPPEFSASDLELIIRRPAMEQATLRGRVTNQDGEPIPGALVSLGDWAVTTAKDGSFQLPQAGAEQSAELVAAASGHLPGRLHAIPDVQTGLPLWPDWIELVLGGPPLSLSGRVLDENGQPRQGMRLWIDDPTGFGIIGDDLSLQLENLAAPADSSYSDSSDDYFRWTTTDERGKFILQGLLERSYTLGVLDPRGATTERFGPFLAGRSDLVLDFQSPEASPVFGRIVSGTGRPMEGVRVALYCPMFGGVNHQQSELLTDEEGRFAFEAISGTELTLWLRGERIIPGTHVVGWLREEEGLISVEALCHFKVELLSDPDFADEVRVFDVEGGRLDLREIGAHGYTQRSSWELIEGRSIPLGVSERASVLVLVKGGEEVRRVPLQLSSGELRIIGD